MTPFEIGQRLIRLEQSLRELETLQHQVHEEALALSQAVMDHGVSNGVGNGPGGPVDNSADGAQGDGPRRVSSVPEAARQLGISVSMVHKLLRERRLGHLKVGARTLITAEHLEEFLATTSVGAVDAKVAGSSHQIDHVHRVQRVAHDGAA